MDIGRGIKVKPFSLVDHFKSVNPISSIDGAIIIDEDGICYAIGVILDGKAYNVGDTSRGARYNSAITFISNQITREKKWKNNPYIGVVISEDKTLDIVSFNEGEGTLYKESLKIR